MGPVRSDQVYLVQGQYLRPAGNGGQELAPVIVQCIVVAEDDQKAYGCLAEQKPDFRPIGFATLADYEKTARNIRAALKKENASWPVLLAAGIEA